MNPQPEASNETCPPPPDENAVFYGNQRMRRVLRVLGGRVFYSVGGNANRSCQIRTWQRWVRRSGAQRVK